jgi:hypothetical protein
LTPTKLFHWRWLAAALCTAWATGADARLGETPEECAARYGEVVGEFAPPVKDSDAQGVHYRKDGIDVKVEFRRGKAWSLTFAKVDMTDEQRELILQANSGAATWEGPEKFLGRDFWITADGRRHAYLRNLRSGKVLQVMTGEYLDALDRLRQEKLELVGTPEADKLLEAVIAEGGEEAGVSGF